MEEVKGWRHGDEGMKGGGRKRGRQETKQNRRVREERDGHRDDWNSEKQTHDEG